MYYVTTNDFEKEVLNLPAQFLELSRQNWFSLNPKLCQHYDLIGDLNTHVDWLVCVFHSKYKLFLHHFQVYRQCISLNF